MKLYLFSSLFLSVFFSYSQEPKKLLKLIGGEFKQVEPSVNKNQSFPKDAKFYIYSYTTDDSPNQYFQDTSGVSLGAEFLNFQESLFRKKKASFKLIKKDWVTNGEYWEFIDFVQDSIMRDNVYRNDDPTGNDEIEEAALFKMLKFNPAALGDKNDEGYKEVDYSEQYRNRELFGLNYDFDWEKKFSYAQYYPLIDRLYLPDYEEYENEKAIDFRKLIYKWEFISSDTLITCAQSQIFPDESVWSKNSKHPYDLHHYMSEHMLDQGYSFPIQGINGVQVEAYLAYLTKKYQTEIDENKLNYWVDVRLPNEDELNEVKPCEECPQYVFEVEEFDHSENWKITNSDYNRFLNWVKDSIIREKIFFDDDIQDNYYRSDQLIHENVYFDRANMAWIEFDPADASKIRREFRFNYKYDWQKGISSEKLQNHLRRLFVRPFIENGQVNFELFDPKKVVYHFKWKDYKSMSENPDLESVKSIGLLTQTSHNLLISKAPHLNKSNKEFATNYGVRSWDDLSRFHIGEYINVTPGIDCKKCNLFGYGKYGDNLSAEALDSICGKCVDIDSQKPIEVDYQNNPEALVQGLTYDQAIAFYHWSYIRGNRQPKKWDTRLEVFPSEEQFRKVQKGESVELETREIPYQTPFFRYVIHVYPKD